MQSNHIVHVVPNLVYGGVFHHLRGFSRLPQRFDTTVVSIFDLDSASAIASLGRPVVQLRCSIAKYRDTDAISARITAALRDVAPSVVHSHHCFSDVYAFPAAAALSLPAIRSIHGITQARWDDPLDRSRALTDWTGDILDRELALERFVRFTLVVSEELRRRTERYGLVKKRFVVYPGVDFVDEPHHAMPAVGERRPGTTTIGFLHRLEHVKAPMTLLPLVKALRDRGIDPVFVILRIGTLTNDLERAIRDAGLAEAFIWLEAAGDLWDHVPALDVFLVTSVSEGVPLVMLEAMARGVPVVATDVGGIPEAIVDGRSGFLIAPGDVQRMAECIVRVASMPDRSRVVQRARDIVRTKFALERHLGRMEQFYDACVSGSESLA